MSKLNPLPEYMDILFNKIYAKPTLSRVLDDKRVVSLCGIGIRKKIIRDLLHDITKNAHVLQIGLTFGDELTGIYNKVEKSGKLDVFDISDEQIALAKEKFAKEDIHIYNYDASLAWDEKYDVIICYNLLRELPLKTREKVMDNVLNALSTGGRAVFIDYSKPLWWNPLKWPLFIFNRLYRPFAESLWLSPLESFCRSKDNYRWHHVYYGGRLYQKTVAVRKILSNEDVRKLTKMFNKK
jgi:ubiquinone/menaquinone biosynthesis C-methylase UbiE